MSEGARLRSRLLIYGAVAAFMVNLPVVVLGGDPGPMLLTVLVVMLATLILLVIAVLNMARQWFSAISMLVIFGAFTWFLFRASDDIRTAGRWLLESRSYKARVLAAPAPQDGTLNHVEWDGWGFAGAGNTTVYLVYDPVNELAQPAANRSEGKFPGLPCPVVRVHKLENHWYTVRFYTDTSWDYCT